MYSEDACVSLALKLGSCTVKVAIAGERAVCFLNKSRQDH